MFVCFIFFEFLSLTPSVKIGNEQRSLEVERTPIGKYGPVDI